MLEGNINVLKFVVNIGNGLYMFRRDVYFSIDSLLLVIRFKFLLMMLEVYCGL